MCRKYFQEIVFIQGITPGTVRTHEVSGFRNILGLLANVFEEQDSVAGGEGRIVFHNKPRECLERRFKDTLYPTRAGFQKRLILVSWLASFTVQAILSDK